MNANTERGEHLNANPLIFYHTHEEEKQECSPLAFFINSDATFSYKCGGISWKKQLDQKEDYKIRLQVNHCESYNHLVIGFDVAYRVENDQKWVPLLLYYDISDGQQSFNSKNFKVFERSEVNALLVDFNSYVVPPIDKITPCVEKREIKLSSSTARIQDLQNAIGKLCTINEKNGRYHSEGIALSYLLDNNIFNAIINYVKGKNGSAIDGCIMKFYSTNELCTPCQSVLKKSRPIIEENFNEVIRQQGFKKEHSSHIPMIFVGMGFQWFWESNSWRISSGSPSCRKRDAGYVTCADKKQCLQEILLDGSNLYLYILPIGQEEFECY